MKNKWYLICLILISTFFLDACHKGMGCPADQYNDWKKIEAARKQQLKSPNNPNKGKSKKGANVVGNGVVPK